MNRPFKLCIDCSWYHLPSKRRGEEPIAVCTRTALVDEDDGTPCLEERTSLNAWQCGRSAQFFDKREKSR